MKQFNKNILKNNTKDPSRYFVFHYHPLCLKVRHRAQWNHFLINVFRIAAFNSTFTIIQSHVFAHFSQRRKLKNITATAKLIDSI